MGTAPIWVSSSTIVLTDCTTLWTSYISNRSMVAANGDGRKWVRILLLIRGRYGEPGGGGEPPALRLRCSALPIRGRHAGQCLNPTAGGRRDPPGSPAPRRSRC